MLILIDAKAPQDAKRRLSDFGNMVEFSTSEITYEAISGHPDIFFCPLSSILVVAPNIPKIYFEILKSNKLNFMVGKNKVGAEYPATAHYNAVITEDYIFHKSAITDEVINNQLQNQKKINVKQAYTRCNLLPLKENNFITSDRGILSALSNEQCKVLFVNPENITLPGFNHGFFGGTCGVFENKIFMVGNLNYHQEGESIRSFIYNLDYEIIELFDSPLFDVGSILFLE